MSGRSLVSLQKTVRVACVGRRRLGVARRVSRLAPLVLLAWLATASVGAAEPADEPVDPAVVDFVAMRLLGEVPEPAAATGATVPSPAAAANVRLTLNKATFDLGEPILATFSVTNASTRAFDFEIGGDYRAGRPERFRFRVIHESADDPAKGRILLKSLQRRLLHLDRPDFLPASREALIEFAREAAPNRADPKLRAAAIICLGFAGDDASTPIVAGFLASGDGRLREAAALALLALGDDRSSETCVDVLSRTSGPVVAAGVSRVASRLGMENPTEAFDPRYCGLASRYGKRPTPCPRFEAFARSVRRRILTRLYRNATGREDEPALRPKPPLRKKSRVCPADPAHRWYDNPMVSYLSFCPICGAALEMDGRPAGYPSPAPARPPR